MCLSACHWAKVGTIVYACSKEKVSSKNFEGTHSLKEINKQNIPPLTLVHEASLEEDALKIFTAWEVGRKR